MSTGWFGSPAGKKTWFQDAEQLEAGQNWEGTRCAVWLSNPGAFAWLEDQLRREQQAKTWLLLSVEAFSTLCLEHPWLKVFESHFLQLPPASESEPREHLNTLKPLEASALLSLRETLYAQSWRRLAHDAAKSLLDWPRRRDGLIAQLKRFQSALPAGHEAKASTTGKLLSELDSLTPDAIRHLIERMGPDLAPASGGWSSSFGQAAHKQRLRSVLRHWQAIPEKINRVKDRLTDLTSQAELGQKLANWLEETAPLPDGNSLVHLQSLLMGLTEQKDFSGSPLAVLLHNTLEQHVSHIVDELEALGFEAAEINCEGLSRRIEALAESDTVNLSLPSLTEAEAGQALHVLVIENEPSWQQSIHEALDVICRSNGWTRAQVVYGPELSAGSRDEAEALLRTHKNRRILVITDLSIPAGSDDEPRPETGAALLQKLLATGRNLPLLMLTTPQHALEEHRRLCAAGFNDVDFVLKLRLEHLYERLEEWLHRQIDANYRHRIVLLAGLQSARIDGVDLELGGAGYAALQALARAHQRGGRAYSSSELSDDNAELRAVLAKHFDAAGFSKLLFQLRKDIRDVFARAERFIALNEVIESQVGPAGQKVYQIPPQNLVQFQEVGLSESDEAESPVWLDRPEPWQKPRLLIVEDEPLWSAEIEELARQMGFDCRRAGSIRAANDLLRDFRPDLLTLDLQLPQDSGAEGIDSGGFDVLQFARQLNPAIRTIIPSTLYRRSALLAQASRLGVPLIDFVPKGSSYQGISWQLHLYNRLRQHRLELQALQDQAETLELLPPLNLRLLEAPVSGPYTFEVNGKDWRGNTLEAALLARLAQSTGQWLSQDTLYQAIYPGHELSNAKRHEEFEQTLKRARKVLVQQWLHGASAKLGPILLERRGTWLCLHANALHEACESVAEQQVP